MALLTLFRIYGGPLGALVEFLRCSLALGSGYSSQMSGIGPAPQEVVIIVGMMLAVLVTGVGVLRRKSYAPLALIVLFPLFVMFKGAIVRPDIGHFSMSVPPMVGLVAFLLAGCDGRRQTLAIRALVAIFLGGCMWLAPLNLSGAPTKGIRNTMALWQQASIRSSIRRRTMKRDYILPPQMISTIGSATVDIYPHTTCYAVYNDLNWKPRPVFQSYATYDPILDRKCASFYAGANAPEFVLYKHESIDTEHPCIVDPRTWLELARWYDLADRCGDILLLKRRRSPRWQASRGVVARSLAFGERWEVPQCGDGPVILRARPKLSPAGKLTNLIYKVYAPRLRVEYEDGTTAEHLLVWRNLPSGFLVSDLPRDVTRVGQFLDQGAADRVRAITFLDDHGAFEKTIQVAWSRVPLFPSASEEVPQSTVPIALNQMTWEGGTGARPVTTRSPSSRWPSRGSSRASGSAIRSTTRRRRSR